MKINGFDFHEEVRIAGAHLKPVSDKKLHHGILAFKIRRVKRERVRHGVGEGTGT